ncbi:MULTISPECIES: SMP-30/gluconolactonase/LRE family protein [Pseudofrankia]|uniref:SMP-30/gluconolactonase/LRE family protein n=1 Tax=Pseudofrankia TaxID=2994363 RepID=UPI000234BCC5|nr:MULTISPECIES: SMP-30/gluconolactonase/LRE family protein [Pseudofrankia]OHV41606.1 gluconolaconase [Pseudofrankia sp. EUN1h]
MVDVRLVTDARMTMGEGPVWDVDRDRLSWIDVFQATVHQCNLDGGDARSTKFPGRVIASLSLRKGGGAVVTSGSEIHLFDLDSGETELIFDADGGPGFGFNDGTVDRQGRFVTGMADMALVRAIESGQGDLTPSGSLYRVDTDLSVHVTADPIGVTNGPCFDETGTTFYCNDSAFRRIYAWDYDPASGEATDRRVVAQFEDGAVVPDGTTVDEQGCLWVAAYRGGEIRRYAPDGTLDRRVPVPVASPTSVAFAGPQLDVLVVTSRGGTTAGGDNGRVLALRGLGVRGLPEPKFG